MATAATRAGRALAASTIAVALTATACTHSSQPPPLAVSGSGTAPAAVDGPAAVGAGITIRKVADVPAASVRLARNPLDGTVYLLNPQSGILRVGLADGSVTLVAAVADIVDGVPAGLAFGPDGSAYVVGNKSSGTATQATVRRGRPAAGGFAWTTVATTAPYPLSATAFDHLYNGVAVSPDGTKLYVNAGSRTDHGEVEDNGGAFPNVRETPLTSAIFELPAGAADLRLDDTTAATYQYADGTRNAYSLAFAPTGELFATDNGPDADFPDELNRIVRGAHYGFPWRFGSEPNPQSAPGYDPAKDHRIQPGSGAATAGTYRNDPDFPKAPMAFTDALANSGPAGVHYRDDSGAARDAAADRATVSTFTPHRSPLGLVFAPAAAGDRAGELHAFVLSWGATVGDLPDRGKDLLRLTLTPTTVRAGYAVATSEQLATGFKSPIDEILVDGRLYVLEYGDGAAIWELTLPR